MCGIAGVAFSDPLRQVDRVGLRRMTASLRHRGPDGEGFHAGPGVGLGFRRLAIVDLATGDQPIFNEDRSVAVVCNGEIYNHARLRARLSAAGHRFATASDVEVIVHLYEESGDAFVDALHGMFALAIWDAKRSRLLLARDRLGIKPLHYAIARDALLFGSEQKAILASDEIDVEPDFVAMRQLLTHGRVRSPRTLVAAIRSLPAGHLLSWSSGRVEMRRYWDAAFPARDAYDHRRTAEDWSVELRDRLEAAVRSHLQGEVPIGAWLSGGIDSSAVAALASRFVDGRMPTFTMRVDDPRDDELAGARALDAWPEYRLDGHAVVTGAADFASMPDAVRASEGSILATTGIGQHRVARASSARVKVVLTGEGSDETLGGYSWYPTLRRLAPVFLLPRTLRRALSRVPAIAHRWPGAAYTIAGPREMGLERYSRSITHLPSQRIAERIVSPEAAAAMQRREAVDAGEPPLPHDFERWHPFAQMQYLDLKHRLGEGVIVSLDRASMAHSVEARVPFLDHELVEFCARIPPGVKLRGGIEKRVLRDAMAGVLPREIATRPKFPMRVPVDRWLRGPLPEFAREALSASSLRATGYFVPEAVDAMVARHRAGVEDCGQAISAVLTIELWDRLFRTSRAWGAA